MISVFTPLSQSGNGYIGETWKTLKSQTYTDWEWVVLENNGGQLPKKIARDPRVRLYEEKLAGGNIGALKRQCCKLAQGDVLLELDHDDLLHDCALEETAKAFEDPIVDFVYSDTAEFHDGTWAPNVYRTDCGWSSYEVYFQGHRLLAQPQPPVTPHNIRLIDWSPNHLRAWRSSSYWNVGAHDPLLPVIDDHDLIVRMYLAGLCFRHIPQCLYFYRVHSGNTVGTKNALIRSLTQEVYDRNIFALAEKFADESHPTHRLLKIDLCGGIDTAPGYEPLDLSLGHDLNHRWPLDDHSVGVLRAYDAIEHLTSPIHTMNEAYRVLAPGGFFFIRVPSTDGRGAFQDPTHVSFWNENSFWYYTKHSHARYVPGLKARFQLTRLRTFYPNPGMEEARIPFVEAHLIALKEGYSPMGLVEM
jgi:O-antigen biosynthesis protein